MVRAVQMMLSNRGVCFVFVVIVWGHHGVMRLHAQGDDLHRITDFSEGLQVLYDFDDIRANQILDRSGKLPPMNLQIEDMTQVQSRDGVLSIRGSTVIASQRPAKSCERCSEVGGNYGGSMVAIAFFKAGWTCSNCDFVKGCP